MERLSKRSLGEYNHTIDAKGRLIFPTKYREQLGEGCIITKGIDNCLYVYDYEAWEAFEEKIDSLPIDMEESRQIQRFFLGSAMEGTFDSQGRILVAPPLREYAGFEKELTLTGVGSRIEIWDRKKYKGEELTNISNITSKFRELGLSL